MKSIFGSLFDLVQRIRHGAAFSTNRFETLTEEVNDLSGRIASLDNKALAQQFRDLQVQFRGARAIEQFQVPAFALIREAAARTLGLRPYDVQMHAAFALRAGHCVEMQTGEGKTLAAAVAACFLAAFATESESSVHILTFNDYLAERDADWMQPLFEFCGLSVGRVTQGMSRASRRSAYKCNIVYITAKEAGFDFLRDQLCQHPDEQVQCGYNFAIVDEADSLLIDEARTPLVIATEADRDGSDLYEYARLVRSLTPRVHFEVKASGRNISFTESGLRLLESHLNISELHSEEHADKLARLNLALHAQGLLARDIDYLVLNDAIELIDEFTGRVAENRKWPGGLQAALEAKEGVSIQPQGQILNSITLQHFLSQYENLAGMTGTAVEATEEFGEFYGLQVVVIPSHRPCMRVDHADRIFSTTAAKFRALTNEITTRHRRGQPILIGTASVAESESLAAHLLQSGIHCRVLNAANDSVEADVIAEAGAQNAVTISTNMAGRGTDICLGGSDSGEREEVVALGGLYVVGTNRHESRRIDNQLRGRAGRQGDPGESEFFISLQDDLIARHGIAELLVEQDVTADGVDQAAVAKKISHVQRVIEGESFEIRRTLRVYSFLIELQRQRISKDRDAILRGDRAIGAFRKKAPDLRERLVQEWGESVVAGAERRVTLLHLDWCWSDHLAHAAEIRQGIHLVSFGGFNPYDVFNREMQMEFDSFLQLVEDKVVATLSSARWSDNGIELEDEGLTAPSSTWTFMINDNPRGAVLGQLIRRVVRKLRDTFQQ